MAITCTQKIITVAMAKKLLKNNPANRKIREHHVNYLKDQMVRELFVCLNDAITISKTGKLLNGQHRLTAQVQCNLPQPYILLEGVEDDDIKNIDIGDGRTLADIFEIYEKDKGYFSHNAAFTKNLIKFSIKILHHDTGWISKNTVMPSLDEQYEYFKQHKRAHHWIKFVISNKRLVDFNPSSLALGLYLTERRDKKALTEFLKCMFEGGDYPNSPSLHLPIILRRRKLEDVIRPRAEDFFAWLWAFDLWLEKKPMKNIDFKKLKKHAPTYYPRYKIKPCK